MPQDHATPAEANAASPNIPGLVPASAPPLASPTPTPGGDNGDRNEASHTRRHARSRTRTWVFGLAIIATIAAVSYAVRYFSYAGAHPSTDDAFVQGDTTIISAKVSGRVTRILVKGYQHVRKGELLVELDPVDAEIALQQAQAGLEAAHTRVSQAAAALVAQRHQAAASFAQAQAAQAAATARVPQSQTSVTLEDQTVHESNRDSSRAIERGRRAGRLGAIQPRESPE